MLKTILFNIVLQRLRTSKKLFIHELMGKSGVLYKFPFYTWDKEAQGNEIIYPASQKLKCELIN